MTDDKTKKILDKAKENILKFKEVKFLFKQFDKNYEGQKLLKELIPDPENIDSKEIFSEIHNTSELEEMLLNDEKETVLHNNCAGKHIMMLGLCKMNGWDMASYDSFEHPLQIKIKEKITELCRLNHRFPLTKDGCGVPIMSMPLENMLFGYLNIFTNPRYQKITNAFLNQPYLIGGENRLDTKIIQNSNNIIAKVGAGGLCIAVNIEKQEAFVVKISDCDMKAREAVVIKSLKNLHWADIPFDNLIKTLHGEIVGEIVVV